MSNEPESTEKILYRVGKITGDLEQLPIEDRVTVIEMLIAMRGKWISDHQKKLKAMQDEAQAKAQQAMEEAQREREFGLTRK